MTLALFSGLDLVSKIGCDNLFSWALLNSVELCWASDTIDILGPSFLIPLSQQIEDDGFSGFNHVLTHS